MNDQVGEESATGAAAEAGGREARRRERQARVGLLRNPNRKPLPPPRRPPLIGRSLRLRSSRRPPADPATAAGDIDTARPDRGDDPSARPADPLIIGSDGRIAGIDVERLQAMAESQRPARKLRASYGQPILEPDEPMAIRSGILDPPPDTAPSATTPEPADTEPPPGCDRSPGGWRRWLARLTGRA